MGTRENSAAARPAGEPVYYVADWEVDPARGCLRKGGTEYPLRQKAFRVLVYLLEQQGRLVPKEELMEHIWKETAVTDDVLVQCIMDVRRALDDDSQRPRFIKTIPRVGYRFIAPVEVRGPNGGLTLKRKEATSIEIEYEEEVADSVGAADVARTGPPALPAAQRPYRKAAVLSAAGVVLIAAVALAFGLPQRVLHRGKGSPETTLPQVPGKTAVAVMSFENQSGNADLDWLRDGLADMLITDLSRSSRLTLLSRQQLHVLLDRIGHSPAEAVRLQEALEVAQKSRAMVFLSGEYAKFGDKLRIGVQVHDARTGQLLRSESLVADQLDQIPAQIDLLSLKLLSFWGASPADPGNREGLAEVMTDNLEAYRDYSIAVEKAQALHNREAIALLEKAISRDPRFAMAYARIGYTYGVTWGKPDEGKPYLEKAFQLSSHLTEKDKLSIAGWYAIANQDYPGAVRVFREMIARYPMEVEAYWRLGHLLEGEERPQEAMDVAKQGLIIDPEAPYIYNLLCGLYKDMGHHDQAIPMCQRYVALAPKEPNAYDSLGLAYEWAGLYDRALEAYQQARALNPDFEIAVVHLGNVYFQLGRYEDAIRQYRRYIRVAPSPAERERGYENLARVYLRKGKLDQAEAIAKTELNAGLPRSYWPVLMSMNLSLERNDLKTAERLVHKIDEPLPRQSARGQRFFLRETSYFQGYLALKTGNAARAIELFKEALRHRPMSAGLDAYEDCVANAYLELGRFDEAIAEYERILRLNPNYPLARYHLGQAYERKGQLDRARSEYQKFLEIWNDADPDIPEVIAARARLASQPS